MSQIWELHQKSAGKFRQSPQSAATPWKLALKNITLNIWYFITGTQWLVVFLSGYPRPHFSDFSWKRLYNHSKLYPNNSYKKRRQNSWSWGVRIYQEIDCTGLWCSQGFRTTCFDWTSFVCTFWNQDNQIPWSCWHYTHLVRLSKFNTLCYENKFTKLM